MARSRQVTIQFLGDAKGLISASNAAGRSTTTLGDKLKRVGKAAIIGFGVAAVAAGKAMYDMAESAVEDEKAASLLARTIKNATGATDAQVSSVEDWISAQGRLYGITDDDLRPALGKLVTATGDISKAQGLASLAMDVAAGRGKSLSQVTEALAKAQSGNIGGLGRLGIATKDAAGETKTLAQITDDLAKQYKGSAATAADTAAGKFQRLKVELAETAEGIGYKLLPYANDLGDWLLDTGVPALEDAAGAAKRELTPALHDLADWVGDNKDEMHDLGSEIVRTVIPAIRDVGGFVGDAVGYFSHLPDPVKRVGIEAGIAAAVLPRLSGAITGVTTAVGINSGKLAGWRRALIVTAGIAGIGAITEGAKKGNKAVGVMGSALTGAFVGGTIGSAIPVIGTGIGAVAGAAVGAGVGLVRMHKGADAAGDSAKGATPKIDGLRESLNQVTGATTRATKALILQRLQEDGVVSSAGQLGIATSDLIKSVLGNKKAIDRVNDAWAKNGNLLDGIQNQKISSFLGTLRQDLSKTEAQVKKDNAALDGTDRKSRQAAASLGEVGKARPQTDKWTALYTGDLNKAVKYTSGASPKMRALLSGVTTSAGKGVQGVDKLAQHMANLKDKDVTITVHYATMGRPPKGDTPVGSPREAAGPHGKVYNLDDYRKNIANAVSGKIFTIPGNNLIEVITAHLKKSQRTLKNVLDGLQSYIQTKTDKLNEILSDRNSFVEGFRDSFSQSIFSAQFTDAEGNQVPPTLQKMMEFAQQQRSNAKALAGNVRSLLDKGLSRDLLAQLAGEGQSGFDQIAALATGSQADIAAFNALNAETRQTLEALGTDLYSALNPGTQDQIKLLQTQIEQGNRSVAALEKIAKASDKDDEIHIKGTDLVILLRRQEKATGQKLLVTPA